MQGSATPTTEGCERGNVNSLSRMTSTYILFAGALGLILGGGTRLEPKTITNAKAR